MKPIVKYAKMMQLLHFLPSVAGRSRCRYTQQYLHNHACLHTHMGYEPIISMHTHAAILFVLLDNNKKWAHKKLRKN